jgi:hypothetical protein
MELDKETKCSIIEKKPEEGSEIVRTSTMEVTVVIEPAGPG